MYALIKQIYDTDIVLSGSWYGRKIRSCLDAYGTNYDFCRLFAADSGGYILIYNSTLTVDGDLDADELSRFVSAASPVNVEVPQNIKLRLGNDYKEIQKTLFRCKGGKSSIRYSDVKVNEQVRDIFPILEEGFGLNDFDMWYVDIMHRIRHGISDVFAYESTTLTKLFDIDDHAFIALVATAAADRGKGRARELLYTVCGELEKQGKKVYLYARDERVSFYESIGFEPVSREIFYEKEGY